MKPVLPLVCVLLLSGCAIGHMREPNTALPAGYDLPTQPAAPAELERWWTSFNDPQLNTLVEQALAASPTAKLAIATLQEARATRDQEYLGAVLPTGSLGVNATTNGDVSNGFAQGNGVNASFAPSWELDLFGQVRAGNRGLNAQLQGARFQYEATRTALIANVAADLFQARGLAAQLAEATEDVRIAQGEYDVANQKYQRGLGARADADSLQATVASSQAQVATLSAQLEASKRALLVLTGRGTDPRASLTITADLEAPPPPPAAVPGDLLTRRPDVRVSQEQVEIATDTLTVANLAYLPTIRLDPAITLAIPQHGGASSVWSLGLGLTQPILNLPVLRAQDRVAVARGEEAVIGYEATIQQAYADAETTLLTMQADQTALAALTAGEAAAHSAYNARQIGYNAGLTDLTTLLQAEQSWRGARQALITRQTAALQDAVNTYKALGGGWDPAAPAKEATSQGAAQ